MYSLNLSFMSNNFARSKHASLEYGFFSQILIPSLLIISSQLFFELTPVLIKKEYLTFGVNKFKKPDKKPSKNLLIIISPTFNLQKLVTPN